MPDKPAAPEGSFRRGATLGQCYADPNSGIRGLQDFQKISILEVKGYCYGWHFYQAADADLLIASDDALFGHPSFRYYGWGQRMRWWAQTMGIRKFQDQLEAEVEKYALACSRHRPTDTVFMQRVFFEIMKQFQGEYLGSMLSGVFESMGGLVRPDDEDEFMLDGAIQRGLGDAVNDNDGKFPPEWRLSTSGRKKGHSNKKSARKRKQ